MTFIAPIVVDTSYVTLSAFYAAAVDIVAVGDVAVSDVAMVTIGVDHRLII